MPTRPFEAQLRRHLHHLADRMDGPLVEEVALAMVKSAAQSFREISSAEPSDANRRLLAALELDVPAAVATLAH